MDGSLGTTQAVWRRAACLMLAGAPVLAVAQPAVDGSVIAAKGTAAGAAACIACHGAKGEGNP